VQVSKYRRTPSGLVFKIISDFTLLRVGSLPPPSSTTPVTPPLHSSSSTGESRVVPFETLAHSAVLPWLIISNNGTSDPIFLQLVDYDVVANLAEGWWCDELVVLVILLA